MDYNDIKTTTYAYADRTDAETIARYDDFLRITESKINRVLKTLKMTARASITTVTDAEYYGLPDSFEGMRDIQINGTNASGENTVVTCEYRTPAQINERMNNVNVFANNDAIYYSIINNQLQIVPPQENNTIEMVYYKKVPPLTPTVLTNWISDENPDCYIFGVLTEISSFNKDAETAALWSARFEQSLGEIVNNDVDIRYGSGNQLQIRTI